MEQKSGLYDKASKAERKIFFVGFAVAIAVGLSHRCMWRSGVISSGFDWFNSQNSCSMSAPN